MKKKRVRTSSSTEQSLPSDRYVESNLQTNNAQASSLNTRMSEYLNAQKPAAAAAAIYAINLLPVWTGADRTRLTVRLCRFLMLARCWKKFRSLPKRKWRKRIRVLSGAIGRLQKVFDLPPGADVELLRISYLHGNAGDFEDYRGAVEKLLKLKTLIDNMPPNKGGKRDDPLVHLACAELSDLFFDATGQAPAPKSGTGYGTFYRFVKAALAGTLLNADTVTRKGAALWRDRSNDRPPSQQKAKPAFTRRDP